MNTQWVVNLGGHYNLFVLSWNSALACALEYKNIYMVEQTMNSHNPDNRVISSSICVFCDQRHNTDYACEEMREAIKSLARGKVYSKAEAIKIKASKR